MLTTIRRWWFTMTNGQAERHVLKGENNEPTVENIKSLYRICMQGVDQTRDDVTIRSNRIAYYRKYVDLYDLLEAINAELTFYSRVTENYSLGVFRENTTVDNWLIDENKYRIDFLFCMSAINELVVAHIELLENIKENNTKSYFDSIKTALFTVHSDLVAFAEVQLRHYSQR